MACNQTSVTPAKTNMAWVSFFCYADHSQLNFGPLRLDRIGYEVGTRYLELSSYREKVRLNEDRLGIGWGRKGG